MKTNTHTRYSEGFKRQVVEQIQSGKFRTVSEAITPDKPVIFSEFGGEAMYGERGATDIAHNWSEDYQAEIFRQNLEMFKNIPNLRGTVPWVLFDFRDPFRMHQTYQNGWNRKGLVSDKGQRKMAWQVMKNFYDTK